MYLARQDLRILVGLLTGHVDLNRHLHVNGLHQDSGCRLSQEDEDTALHFIVQCNALMLLRKNILDDYALSLDSLRNIQWFLLLKFAKASNRFYRLWGLSGLHIGPMLWPQCWVSVLTAGIQSSGKVRYICKWTLTNVADSRTTDMTELAERIATNSCTTNTT